jgi:hypothetical protein
VILNSQKLDSQDIPSRREFMLDPRTICLFQDSSKVYLWVGSKCHPSNTDIYFACAINTFEKLKEFEFCPDDLTIINEGEETSDFLLLLKCSETLKGDFIRINKNWNNWFINLEEDSKIRSARSYKSKLIYAEREEIQFKPALFVYPYYTEPLYVLDIDDLTEDVFAILCDKESNVCFIWKGSTFNEEEISNSLNLQEFVHLAVQQFYETEDFSFIEFLFENSAEESEQFLKYFS